MENCPVCKARIGDPVAKECPKCGVIFEKWQAKVAAAVIALDRPPVEHRKFRSPSLVFAVLLLGFLLAMWVLWPMLAGRVGADAPTRAKSSVNYPCSSGESAEVWDVQHAFPGGPMGLAWTGEHFLSCNRMDPWGVVQMRCDGTPQAFTIVEPAFKQKVQLQGLAWNGTQAVGIVDGAWFQTAGQFFVPLEGRKLRLGKRAPAPPLVNSLTWDGSNYWTATRRNTQDSPEEAFLYKLDKDFNVVQKWPAPAYGCQGLTWAESVLVWGDVFEDALLLLKVEGETLTLLHKFKVEQDYLSGVAWDGQALWLANYGTNKIERLPLILTRSWLSGDYRVSRHEMLTVGKLIAAHTQGDPTALGALMEPLLKGNLSGEEAAAMAEAIVSLDLRTQGEKALSDILARPESETHRPMLTTLLTRFSGQPAPVAAP